MDFQGFKDKISKTMTSIADVVMPVVDVGGEGTAENVENAENAPAVFAVKSKKQESVRYDSSRQVANGGTVYYNEAGEEEEEPVDSAPKYEGRSSRPHLTVHTTKAVKLTVQIYAPERFDEVPHIADDLKAGKAAVVNYEKVAVDEQRRLCDFVNGVCYVLDGSAKRITGKIVLYVPNGVNIEEASASLPY